MALISLNNLERFFNNLKTYISNALSSKANLSHTHTTADISNLAENWNVTGTNLDISFVGSSNNNGQLSIQINGTDITTFTANQITNSTFNLNFNSFGYNLIPASDNSIDIGSSTNNLKMLYTKGITIDGAQFSPSDYVPRSGGAVMTSNALGRTVNNSEFRLDGGTGWAQGASVSIYGKDVANSKGGLIILWVTNGSNSNNMWIYPNGTWTWSGTACQITSDQRFKQQITQIDDKLLDAWEDVNLVQFKYNDAVEEKGNTARLHTGYVVQQIDEACKKHNVDISKYGLYCHEEYAEETREVENADGTKTTEVVRPASEHYSLRYTEALVVECAYLRKQIELLQERLNKLEEK